MHTHTQILHKQNHINKIRLALSLPLIAALLALAGCETPPDSLGENNRPPAPVAPLARLTPFTPLTREEPSVEKINPIVISILQTNPVVTQENATMRAGTSIPVGSSVIISFTGSRFEIDGYSTPIELSLEKGLLAAGLQPKDRSKFEAKIRDIKENEAGKSGLEEGMTKETERLSKQLERGEITKEEHAAKLKEARERFSGISAAQGNEQRHKWKIYDLPELIRVAKDGVERADYILQVNLDESGFGPCKGKPLRIENHPEVLAAIRNNPGLSLGGRGIPRTIQPPWMYARLNAKLFSVETGSIDWVGEYSVESPAVLEDGTIITIPLRRPVINLKRVMEALNAYNSRVAALEQEAVLARNALKNARSGWANQEVEEHWKEAFNNYEKARLSPPAEYTELWEYGYDVGTPIVRPDFQKQDFTPDEKNEVDEHVKALCSRVTRDLMKSIVVK